MKRIILMLALSIGASIALADGNTATYDSGSGLLEMSQVGIVKTDRTFRVTLHNMGLSSGGYLFEIVYENENEPPFVIDDNTPYYDTEDGSLVIRGAFIDGVFTGDSFTLENIELSLDGYLFRYIPSTGTSTVSASYPTCADATQVQQCYSDAGQVNSCFHSYEHYGDIGYKCGGSMGNCSPNGSNKCSTEGIPSHHTGAVN